jgi:hypothetical protein
MRIARKIRPYDGKTFARPWIAKVIKWPVGQRAELDWGTFLGEASTGGELEIEAKPGDVVRYGQKNKKHNSDPSARWAVITSLGRLAIIQTELEAAKTFRQNWQLTAPAIDTTQQGESR